MLLALCAAVVRSPTSSLNVERSLFRTRSDKEALTRDSFTRDGSGGRETVRGGGREVAVAGGEKTATAPGPAEQAVAGTRASSRSRIVRMAHLEPRALPAPVSLPCLVGGLPNLSQL